MSYTINIVPKSTFYFQNLEEELNYYNLKIDLNFLSSILYLITTHTNTQIKMFSDLVVSDYPNYVLRFLSIYNIISLSYNFRLLLKVLVNTNLIIESVTNLYTSASWFERECWDLFGVFFFNNLDLRRILNDYGFNGHPLKKDFPLSGFYETIFSFILGVIIYETIKMKQEFRFFNINSPWKYNINV